MGSLKLVLRAMANNLKMVSYFFEKFHFGKMETRTDQISPDFKLTTPFFSTDSYLATSDYFRSFSDSVEPKYIDVKQLENNEHFEASFILCVINQKLNINFEIKMSVDIVIKNNLIAQLNITYGDDKQLVAELGEIIQKVIV